MLKSLRNQRQTEQKPCRAGYRFAEWEYRQRMVMPLEAKVAKTREAVREFYGRFNGMVYVSFSGGKDSTVLLHLVREQFPEVPAVFCNTGLEWPSVVKFVRTFDNVEVLRPAQTFREVLKTKGFPVVSKRVASAIHSLRNKPAEEREYLLRVPKKPGAYRVPKRWQFLMDAPFKISDQCCNVLKRNPAYRYERRTKRQPMLGFMAGESWLRLNSYLKYGCNAFEAKRPMSTPMAYWREEDVWGYVKSRGIEVAQVYAEGQDRTGCMFCLFGAHLEANDCGENKFQRMCRTHPKLWRYCMETLGLREVMEFMGLPTRPEGEADG